MKEKTTYLCENCGKGFEDYTECEKHEIVCCNKHAKYKENVNKAIQEIKCKYGSIIKNISGKTDNELEYYLGDDDVYNYVIEIELSNGNQFVVNDGCDEFSWLGTYLKTETIVKSLDKAISERLDTSYEGILHTECPDNWREDYLGDTQLCDIVDRLNGRKVRLEVIE